MPTEILFGRGKIKEIGVRVKELGKTAMIVTGKTSAEKLGYTEKVKQLLEKEGVESVVFDQVEQDPKVFTVNQGAKIARENQVDVIIGLGGGSAMDAAKAIALGAVNPGDIGEYLYGKPCHKALPIALITTTAGTGSEANPFSVLTISGKNLKKSLKNPILFAKFSIVDPELMLSIPKRVTASTGIDVFFHAFEAYIGENCQPMTEVLALESIKLVANNLVMAYEEGDNIVYREKMAWASTLAGMAINMSGTCGIHGLGQTIGGAYNIAHGESLTSVALAFMRQNASKALEKFEKVAKLFGISSKEISSQEVVEEFISEFERLLDRLHLPKNISEFGIGKKDIEKLAHITWDTRKGSLESSPNNPNFEEVKAMYLESL